MSNPGPNLILGYETLPRGGLSNSRIQSFDPAGSFLNENSWWQDL